MIFSIGNFKLETESFFYFRSQKIFEILDYKILFYTNTAFGENLFAH